MNQCCAYTLVIFFLSGKHARFLRKTCVHMGVHKLGGTTRLAPEEVHDKQKKEGGVAKADGEKSKTDKKRERRAKKKTKHVRGSYLLPCSPFAYMSYVTR